MYAAAGASKKADVFSKSVDKRLTATLSAVAVSGLCAVAVFYLAGEGPLAFHWGSAEGLTPRLRNFRSQPRLSAPTNQLSSA